MTGVVLITGGSRGIGRATALLAAERGHDVVVSYRNRGDAADEVVGLCRANGRRALALAGDVAIEADVINLFAAAEEQVGPLTGVVINAGIVAPAGRLDSFAAERIERVVAVNVVGALLCAREAVRRMSRRHGGAGGSIVFVSSLASRLGGAGAYVDYAATKGAIDTATIGLAREVARDGVRVNAVRPGVIRTDIHADGGDPGRADRMGPEIPIGRPGEPHEVANAILWLLSEEASYVTGTIVDIGGGR